MTFGTSATSSSSAQIGLGGSTPTDYNNRKTQSNNNWNTTLAGTTNIDACQLPYTGVTITVPTSGTTYTWNYPSNCGSTPSTQPTGISLSTVSNTSISGSFTAASPVAAGYLVVRTTTNTAPVPTNGVTYAIGSSAIGYIESNSAATSFVSTGLLPGTQYYYWVFSYTGFCYGTPNYLATNPLTGSASSAAAGLVSSTALGGLWSSTATWVGGVVPTATDNVTIADGATVTIDGSYTVNQLTIGQGSSGILQWNNTSTQPLTVNSDILINTGAKLLDYRMTNGGGHTINVGGNFTNNGYAMMASSAAMINFNGTLASQTLSGTGTFQGNGTSGIIGGLMFQNPNGCTINTLQNLLTTYFAHYAGTLTTNGKLTIDNTAQVFGQAINTQVISAAVTNVGVAYTTAPVVFGGAVTLWTSGASSTANTRYYSGNNVYVATTGGAFGTSAPTHTSGSASNGAATLLWIGTLGTLGNPYITTALTIGTQYFYGGNLYTAVATTAPTAPPTHTTGVVGSFLYAGTPAQATVNYDATSQTVRSINIINAGTGYSSAPTITFSLNGGTVTTAAAATASVIQSYGATTSSSAVVNGGLTVTGGLNINSTQNATSFSGVGGLITTSGGVNYTIAPTVGFAGPTAINLVTNGGSGYTTAPTITVSGGTLVSGSALTTSNFTITVANGKVVSVYLNAATTATYSTPPTLAFSTGNATLTFPANCWPAATAIIGANGQITNFNITNSGFGYVTAPTVGIGTTSGTAIGGTFTTVATAPTAVLGLYNLTYGWYLPAPSSVFNNTAAYIPTNGKINSITINSSAGASIGSNVELFSSTPLTLTAGLLDFGNNTLNCSNYGYAGTSGSTSSSVSGKIQLTSRGGSVTRTFPFDAAVAVATGTGSLATGSSITTLTATRTAAPSGTVNGNTGVITGNRAYRIQANDVYGTQPTVTLNYNATDALTTPNNLDLLIGQSSAVSGAWVIKSTGTGTGVLSATGSRTTATTGAGPIVPTGDDYFAWITGLPCSGTPTMGVIIGNTEACSGNTIAYTSTIFSTGNGMTYRWQTSTDNGVTWTNTAITTPGSYSQTFTIPIWIRRVDTCTNGNAFAISNVIQVNTSSPKTAPWTENFDAMTTLGAGILPICWLNVSGGSSSTTPFTSANAASNTYNDPLSNPNYVTIYYPSTNASYLWTPAFQLTAGVSYDFSFYFAGDATAGWVGDVFYNTAQSTAGATALGASFVTAATTTVKTYNQVTRSFTPTTTGVYYFGIKTFASTSSPWYMGFDDFKLDLTPSCVTPTSLASSNLTATSATISWSAPALGTTPTGYEYVVSTSNTTPASAGTAVTTTTASITGLSATTTYYVFVRSYCGGSDYSAWSSSVSFTTACNTVTTFSENFDAVTAGTFPSCWNKVGSNGSAYTQASTVISSPNNLYIYSSSTSNLAVVAMPPVSNASNGTNRLKFKARAYSTVGGVLEVGYLTDPLNASTFVALNSFTTTSTTTVDNFVLSPVTTPAGVTTLAFRHKGSPPNGILVDDVVYESISLPVTFTQFTGSKQVNVNILNWSTATELNNKGFALQRSSDGINFTTIAFVNSKAINGNSNATLDYNFIDTKPLLSNNYYRLQQVDIDGKESYSKVVLLKGNKTASLNIISIYPNPSHQTLSVLLSAPANDKVTLVITDIAGKVLTQKIVNAVVGDNTIQVDINKLTAGSYIIKAICDNGCDSGAKKFIKQ